MANPPDKQAAPAGAQRPEELADWMARYGPALRRYFVRKANPADADDLVQEVFLRLQARSDRASADDAERFLFAIAKRVSIDRYRLNAARTGQLQVLADEVIDSADEMSPERILSGKQEYSRAMVAISALPQRMRMALVLHRFGRMSFSAIAQHMGIRKGTVQVLVQRALERVARDMGGRDER